MTLYLLENKKVVKEKPEDSELCGTLVETEFVYVRLAESNTRVTKYKKYIAYRLNNSIQYFIVDDNGIIMKPHLQPLDASVLLSKWWEFKYRHKKEDIHDDILDSLSYFDLTNFNKRKKEMKIETNVTIINGNYAKDYSDADLLEFICEQENTISHLNSYDVKSTKIDKMINQHKENIEVLVKILDSRE